MAKRAMALCCVAAIVSLFGVGTTVAQGPLIQASGPVNRSMGGAAVAAPTDALGALYWNPATISAMPQSETSFSLDVLFPNHTVASSVGPFSGSTTAETGTFPIPNVGWVHHTCTEGVSLGIALNTIAGFGTNLPADPTNPVLAPPPIGLGQVSSNALFLQISPVISIARGNNLSFAIGPTITSGRISLEPFVIGSANPNGLYSDGQATRYHWGGGVQAGVYYITDRPWRFGASFKSPTWMDTFEFQGTDQNGNPRALSADIDLPMIISVGTAYDGFERWLFAFDVRYFNFEDAAGFGDPAIFDNTGKLGGLDYSSVLATSLGIQREVNPYLTVRAGYSYNQNPIADNEAFFTIATPLMYEHTISSGLSLHCSQNISVNVAHSYMFENTRSGPIVLPGVGPVPGSNVQNTMDAHWLSIGLTSRH